MVEHVLFSKDIHCLSIISSGLSSNTKSNSCWTNKSFTLTFYIETLHFPSNFSKSTLMLLPMVGSYQKRSNPQDGSEKISWKRCAAEFQFEDLPCFWLLPPFHTRPALIPIVEALPRRHGDLEPAANHQEGAVRLGC